MSILETYFLIFISIQVFHSIEELSTGFHKKCPFFQLKFRTFLIFEIFFLVFWLAIYFLRDLSVRSELLGFFILLMFANGIWHLTWWAIEKKYVPGIITAPLFVIAFVIFYFKILL